MAALEAIVFLTQAKRKDGSFSKGTVVCGNHEDYQDNLDDANQGLHAYLSAYGYGHEAGTDYAMCEISNFKGEGLRSEFWQQRVQPEPEPEAE